MNITKWNLSKEVQICLLNLGIHKEPQLMKLNTNLDSLVVVIAKQLLKEYKDVFVWTYKDLKNIQAHPAQHLIEFNTSIPASHQTWYWMNSNFATVVKKDLDKLLGTLFIVLVEKVTWFSPFGCKQNNTSCTHLLLGLILAEYFLKYFSRNLQKNLQFF